MSSSNSFRFIFRQQKDFYFTRLLILIYSLKAHAIYRRKSKKKRHNLTAASQSAFYPQAINKHVPNIIIFFLKHDLFLIIMLEEISFNEIFPTFSC
ncbi:hypothetical protein BpHYR1_050584 [Brachionus plicatilis]|uniref:Uncharacterized protein n=1 Tax=Brachionus plicatilis TaxID=10195 RepID=A0A3M7S3V1_BRAPC|nr:hypothetical protein BpHYR1_050584 [Brachionus plicatilis]